MHRGRRDEDFVHLARDIATVPIVARFDGAEHETIRFRLESTEVREALKLWEKLPLAEFQVRLGDGEPGWRFASLGPGVWRCGRVIVFSRNGKANAGPIDPDIVAAVAMEARPASDGVPLP